MRATSPRALLGAAALACGLALAVGPLPTSADGAVTYEACVVTRRPTAALMSHVADRALFELDLRPIPGTPFALRPDDCVTVTGLDRGTGAGLRREFPQADWLIEAWAIEEIREPADRGSPAGSHD